MRHFNYDIHECSSLPMNARKRVPAIKLRDPCSRSVCTHCTHRPHHLRKARRPGAGCLLPCWIDQCRSARTNRLQSGGSSSSPSLSRHSINRKERERERTRVVRSVVLTLEIREGDDQEICSTTSTYNAARSTWPLPVLSRLLFFSSSSFPPMGLPTDFYKKKTLQIRSPEKHKHSPIIDSMV